MAEDNQPVSPNVAGLYTPQNNLGADIEVLRYIDGSQTRARCIIVGFSGRPFSKLSQRLQSHYIKVDSVDRTLRLPRDWAADVGVDVLDPDGWREEIPLYGLKPQMWDVPVSRNEFILRLGLSTQAPLLERKVTS